MKRLVVAMVLCGWVLAGCSITNGSLEKTVENKVMVEAGLEDDRWAETEFGLGAEPGDDFRAKNESDTDVEDDPEPEPQPEPIDPEEIACEYLGQNKIEFAFTNGDEAIAALEVSYALMDARDDARVDDGWDMFFDLVPNEQVRSIIDHFGSLDRELDDEQVGCVVLRTRNDDLSSMIRRVAAPSDASCTMGLPEYTGEIGSDDYRFEIEAGFTNPLGAVDNVNALVVLEARGVRIDDTEVSSSTVRPDETLKLTHTLYELLPEGIDPADVTCSVRSLSTRR